MIAEREEVMKLAREYPGTEEDHEIIVDLVMLILQYPADYAEAVGMEGHSSTEECPQSSMAPSKWSTK